MATPLDILLAGRRRAGQIDAATAVTMLAEYERVMRAVERDLARFAFYIEQAIAANEPVSITWLQRQQWYRQLEASVASEMRAFTARASATLTTAQQTALATAYGTSGSWLATIAGGTFRGRINAPAFERWVTAAMPGSPVREVIDGYGTRVSDAILRHMSEGMGTGRGSETIIRGIMREAGPDASEARIRTLSRSETMRAYRGGSADSMAPLQDEGIIQGWTWHAELSTRTCAVCAALHGTFSTTYPVGFHPACRCIGRPVVNPALVPGGRRIRTGEEWFARQSAEMQRRILPTEAHYEAYRNGVPLSQMVGVKQSPVWGPMYVMRPASAL